jgi:hypothetical protein
MDSDDGSDDQSPTITGSTDVLGKMLRDATAFKLSTHKGKKRRLAPEVINIQRMKHIASSGPVSES